MIQDSLVLFYSWSGSTRRVAQMIAEKTGADLVEKTASPETYFITASAVTSCRSCPWAATEGLEQNGRSTSGCRTWSAD